MLNVMEKAEALSAAIRNSVEYVDYIALLKKVQEESELYDRLNEYRRRSFEIKVSSDTDAAQQMECLREEFSELLANVKIVHVIRAEQAFCKMMRQVNKKIMESIEEMDVSFL